jgi:hypothetical protein
MHNIKKRKKNFMYTISSHNCCLLSSNDVKKKKNIYEFAKSRIQDNIQIKVVEKNSQVCKLIPR